MTVFEGLRVIELADGMAGPLVGTILADNGADVIKVEPPGGDWVRRLRAFALWNRGKRSIALNLESEPDRGVLLDLLSSTDVVVTAFRSGVAQRLGMDYDRIASLNPKIVYCSIEGFAPAHHLAELKAYEGVVTAKTGQLVARDDTRGAAPANGAKNPTYKAIPVDSYGASQLALQGIVAALLARSRSGRGEHVHTSLLLGAMSLVMRQEFGVTSVDRDLNADTVYRGIQLTFLTAQCKDGKWIQMCARQDHHFRAWLQALELNDAIDDPRYAQGPLRIPTITDIEELEARLRERMRTRTQDEWMRVFVEDFDVGADPFLYPHEFLDHPQMVQNGRVAEVFDPVLGPTRQLGPLVNLAETPASIGAPAPRLNEHAEEIRQQARARTAPSSDTRNSQKAPMTAPPLSGVTILELAYFLAAPLGATILAELGARVIKVEPKEGDPWRRLGLESVHLLHGKESIVLDLKTEAGQDVIQRLIEKADVLFTSFRPGVPERLGFGYQRVAQINPRLVYVYAGSYGSRGPWRHRAAFHSTPNALAGGGILQAGDGNPPVDLSYPDPAAGLAVGTAIAMGLWARERTGKGQYVETSMLSSYAYAMSEHMVIKDGRTDWRLPDPRQRGQAALSRLYETSDGWIFLSIVQETEWMAFADAVGHAEWLSDSRFATPESRLEHDAELIGLLEAVFARSTAAEWERELTSADVPCVQVETDTLGAFLVREQLLEETSHPDFGRYWRMPPRITFSRLPSRAGPTCAIGEHTEAILDELGYGSHVARIVEGMAEHAR